MKNILNRIGAVSKPVIFGAALGVATVAVGIGVATNLMSDGPKGVSGRVLGQYSADTASVGSGGGYGAFSKEALEQQMAAAQAAREGGTALDYLGAAGRNKFAYGDNASSYGSGVVDPMAMNNAAYEGGENLASVGGMPSDIGAAMNQFNATAAAVSAKAGQGEGAAGEEGGTEKGALEKAEASATQLNKLNRSNMFGGSSASGVSSGGGARNMGGIMGAMSSDKAAQQAVPSVNMGNIPESNISGIASAKHGRLGAMGGSNSRGGTSGNGGSGQAYFTSTMGELVSAQKYSALGKGTVYSDAEKGFVDAAAAFDGSGEVEEGTQITGSTPMIEKAAALDREASTINKNGKGTTVGGIDNFTQASDKYRDAVSKIWTTIITMIGMTIGGIIAVMAAHKATAWLGGVGGYIVAAIMTVVIIGFGMGMMGLYVNRINNLGYGLSAGPWNHMRYWLPIAFGALPWLGLLTSTGTKMSAVLGTLGGKLMAGVGAMALLKGASGYLGF